MSNAGQVESDCANTEKPNPYIVMQAYDTLPFELRNRICNACLDWDTQSILKAYRNRYFSLKDIAEFIERKEREILDRDI